MRLEDNRAVVRREVLGLRLVVLFLMEIREADRDAIVNELDRIMLKIAVLKAELLEYKMPVCANRASHPHGPAGNCLTLP